MPGRSDPESIRRVIAELETLAGVLDRTSAAGQVLDTTYTRLIEKLQTRLNVELAEVLSRGFNESIISIETLTQEQTELQQVTKATTAVTREEAEARRIDTVAINEQAKAIEALRARGAEGTLPGITGPTGAGAGVGAQQIAKEAQTAENFVQRLTERLAEAGASKVAIDEIIGRIQALGIEFDRFGKVRFGFENAEGFRRLSFEISKGTEIGARFSDQIDTSTQRLREYASAAERAALRSQKFTETERAALQRRFPQAFERAAGAGFGAETIQAVQRDATTGITRLSFSLRNLEGVTEKATVSVNRFGTILRESQSKFKTFGQTLTRNIGEVFKWTIAIQLIYSPLRRLQELIEVAIQNETELANAALIVGRAHADLDEIFNTAAQAAAATGESISGVLEGYTQAFRATGAIRDQTERAAVAQQLLVDSLILSKLSTLDQARAMDTLVGALSQLGRDLNTGRELLDQWVATSRAANVSVDTLAESFAITATAAENAGLSAEELNAIIAVIAETTTLSATEVGNAGRAFIQGFQSDATRDQLARFGIAVETAAGETRSFLDIATEVRALFDAGLISQGQLQQIATAIGGRGARRAAQVQAFLNNLGRIEEVVGAQADAAGQSQDALAIKLDTVQTKLTEVSNAFQTLAQTLGTEGGVVDAFKLILDVVEALINGLSELTELLGGATAPLAIGGGVLAYLNQQRGAGVLAQQFGGLAGGVAARFGIGGAQTVTQQLAGGGGVATRQAFTGGAQTIANVFQRNAGLIGVGIAEAMLATINIAEGDFEGLGGQLAGGAIGALLTGMNPVGILLGSLAGEALFNFMTDIPDTAWEEVFEPAQQFFTPRRDEGTPTAQDITDEEQAYRELFETIGFGFEGVGRFRANLRSLFTRLPLDPVQAVLGETLTPQAAAFSILGGEDEESITRIIGLFQELTRQKELADQGFSDPTISTFLSELTQQAVQANVENIAAVQERLTEGLRESLAAGTISAKEFRTQSEFLESFSVNISKAFLALGDNFEDAGTAYDVLGNTILNATKEQRNEINSLVDEYLRLQEAIAGFGPVYDAFQGQSQVAVQAQAEGIKATLDALFAGIRQAQLEAQIVLPSATTFEDFDAREVALIISRAFELQADFIKDTIALGLQPEGAEFDDVQNQYDDFFFRIGARGGLQLAESLGKEFVTAAQEELEAAGDILGDTEFRLQPLLDISAAELPALLDRYRALVGSLQQQFATAGINWTPDEQTFGAILQDFVAVPITADLQILNLLMQENNDLQQKQLDGVFNLPAGASFFVPFQAARLAPTGGGGGGIDLSALLGQGEQELSLDEERNRILRDGFAGDQDLKEILRDRLNAEERQERDLLAGVTQEQIEAIRPEPTQVQPLLDPFTQTLEEFLGQQALGPPIGGALSSQLEPGTALESFTARPDTFLNQLGGLFQGLFSRLDTIFNFGDILQQQFDAPFQTPGQGVQFPEAPATQLQMDIQSNVNVVLDSQVLGAAISRILHEQLVRGEGSRGGIIRMSVVG